MKKNILKKFLKGVVAAAAAFALASCSFLSVEDDDSSSSSSGAGNSAKGAVSVSMFVPDYYALSTGGSARVVAPQTSSVQLGYKASGATDYTYLDAISLTSDSVTKTEIDSNAGLSGATYKITFSKIPVGVYEAGSLIVNLLDSSNTTVSSGTNSEAVTISESESASGSFYTIPTSSDADSGELAANVMEFAKVTQKAGMAYKLYVTVDSTTYPSVAVFNSDGTFKSFTNLSSSSNSVSFDSVESDTVYYIGFYSATAISSYKASFIPAGRIATTAPSAAGTITLYSSNVTKSTVSSATGTTYGTITAALAAIPTSGDTGTYTIALATGTYEEDGLAYTGTATVKILGLGTATYGTDVLIYGKGSDMSTEKGRDLIEIQGSASVILDSVTLRHSLAYSASGDIQAEVLGYDGTGTVAAYNCSFLSGQDTLRTTGKAWFYKCYIEGDCDFIWMEVGGSVALYEECVIRAISTRSSSAYFAAPRLTLSRKVGKGVVFFNSKLQTESGLDVYLTRNPWASSNLSTYYEQVAFVGTTLKGDSELNSQIYKSVANGTSDQQYVGYKTDSNFAASSKGWGAILSDSVKTAEYAGRNNIVNRIYHITKAKFQADSSIWDIGSVPTDNGWTVTEDTSKYMLEGETELSETVYDFTSASANGYTDTNVTLTGFAYESGKTHASGKAESTISFPVTGKASVTVVGYYAGYGTIQAGEQGKAIYDFNNGTTNSVVEKSYIVYSDASTESPVTVTITAATASYIKEIDVEYDSNLSYTAVASLDISASSDIEIVGVALTLSASASPDNATNADVTWSSSDETVGTIDEYSGKVTFLVAGTVTFTATAADGSGVTATKVCNPIKADWTWAEYFDVDGDLDASDEEHNVNGKYFQAVSAKSTTSATFTTLDGTSVTTSKGVKMNSAGKLSISTLAPATLTIITLNDKGVYNSYTIAGASGATATKVTEEAEAASGKTYTSVWHLDTADSWSISRGGTNEQDTLVYAKVIYDTIVDWHDSDSMGYDSSTSIQNTTGTITSATSGIELSVDATSGKLAARGSDAQFNAGTIITVPVNADSVLTVVAYPGYHNFTVAGAAATDDTTTYTATKDGYVSIVATGGAYLYSITATNVTTLVDHTAELTVPFASSTETVTNDEDTLGLTATSAESSDTGVATAEVTTDGIAITSVAAGSATITASDGTNSATIEVTVGADGSVTVEKITKYSAVVVNGAVTHDLTGSFDELAYSASATNKTTYQGLVLDYTASGSNFKYDSGNKCLTTSNGVIYVPVTGDCTITVACHEYNSTYIGVVGSDSKVTALSATAGTSLTYSYTGDAGYVKLTTTNSSKVLYIYSITVDPVYTSFDLTGSFSELAYSTEASATNKTTYQGLVLDYTASGSNFKYDSTNKCLTTSNGVIYVPVTGDCTITVACHSYNSTYIGVVGSDSKVTALSATAGTSLTYSYTGDAGYVKLTTTTAGNVLYIYSILATY